MSAHCAARRAGAVLLLAVLLAGCGGSSDGKTTADSDPAAGAVDGARAYMSAVLARDWERACAMMAAARQDLCRTIHATPETPEPGGPVIGPVTLDRPATRAPGLRLHPEGWAVMLSHTVAWSGRPVSTTRIALRMVAEAGQWRVDQREDVFDSDLVHAPDPAVAALSRRSAQ
ncbi:hypothetical protein [Streptomyces lavendulae]|uniref:hypothetical protein n=1 Tax=Streptomyces lavendulae TaxID=1914 RepID=UPI0031E5699C